MLKILRKKKTMKRILWALAILIVPAFVLWGAGSGSRETSNTPAYVGKIYNKKITFKSFAKSYQNSYSELVLSSGGDSKALEQLMGSMNINIMAWDRLILLGEIKRQRINVSDNEIVNVIASQPLFRRGNSFDKMFYDYMIRNNLKTSPRDFEEMVREDIAIGKLKQEILKNVSVTDEEVLNTYKKDNEQVKISYILIKSEDFIKDLQISQKELQKFYDEKKENLRRNEEANIRYLYIDVNNKELLYKLNDEIGNNKNFEKIAEENGLKIEETGFFGMNDEIPGIGLSYEVAKAAFSLDKRMTSFPIYTEKGYYIINLTQKRSGYLPTFAEVEPLLSKELTRIFATTSAEKAASEIYNKVNDAVQKGAAFEEAAKTLGLIVEKSKPFSRSSYIEGVGQAQLLKEIIFASPKGQINSPINCEKGFIISRADETISPDEKKFEEEKGKLKENLLAQKRADTFNKWFEEISKNSKLEIDLESLPAQQLP
ncbi:MAG: hypothetical protein COS99_01225 [Candidatus Omnitrophica bacterium CG07_land_8_20_14_0_80_42_15]|uniref:Periplasmic chaperone PpiD n=1 Tax=Candidatus Aquitaenariimonas noxiae TaxID=1974741 RepID=A0A2J0KY69_9BACT|nr:MAG: hypothetical protein COS99_01225 [Candidatus Omnitrophica bacterium CG07_land_8_20_14_0_80_42_15]